MAGQVSGHYVDEARGCAGGAHRDPGGFGGDDKRVRASALGPVAPKFEDQILTCVCVEVNFMLGPGLD
jgi:hypothetical protein